MPKEPGLAQEAPNLRCSLGGSDLMEFICGIGKGKVYCNRKFGSLAELLRHVLADHSSRPHTRHTCKLAAETAEKASL
jgi:hypothetical protein